MKTRFSSSLLSLDAFWNPPPCRRWWKRWSNSMPSHGEATCHHAARSRALSSACPVLLPPEEQCNLCSYIAALSVSAPPKHAPHWCCMDVPGNRCRNSFAVSLLQSPHHCALGHGTWKQSYQNKPFSYKLQVLKIHVIIVLSGSKCAYDAEREQIGLRLKQALPFS